VKSAVLARSSRAGTALGTGDCPDHRRSGRPYSGQFRLHRAGRRRRGRAGGQQRTAVLAASPQADRRRGLVHHHPAPDQSGLRQRLDTDQARATADRHVHGSDRLWGTGPDLVPRGITAADLFAARQVLAATCWATEIRIISSVQHAHLVTLEVIRNSHPERTGPTPHGWPHPRRAAGDGAGEPDERDTPRWSRPAHRVGG
jgi:hypothetical protein